MAEILMVLVFKKKTVCVDGWNGTFIIDEY